MTQDRKDEVVRLMSQMNPDLQEYVLDTLRHLKFAQNTLCKKGAEKLDSMALDGQKAYADI